MFYSILKREWRGQTKKMNESINEDVGTRKGVCCHDCKVEDIINDIFRG